MKYNEIVSFQPIENVIVLKSADKETRAREHVNSFVISDEMARRLKDVLIPHLQYDSPYDNKGILVVGNYGTGKSHLLSVISSMAENSAMLDFLTHSDVRQAAENIAGKFKVVRLEIGATEMNLREIIMKSLDSHLEKWGVDFSFESAPPQYENKSLFDQMMGKFEKKFPEHGLLLVVDELLDYLRSRKTQPLIFDLGFLREIGEVCKDLRFRFIAGVQEAIFESGSFNFVADSVRRVKDRFVQVRIASTDVQYVVANRLLKKTPEQLSMVSEHLQTFTNFYANMNERLDEFAAMFPIHPEYIDVFEALPIVEKRGVLQVISETIRNLLEEEVPKERPGLISFDSYWRTIKENPDSLAIPEVKEIFDCAEVISGKIRHAFPRSQYEPMAQRIVDGLAVHRLTTHDIYKPIGLTPEELRDGLCLFNETVGSVPGDPSANLLTLVEKVLTDIRKTVDGSFISSNTDNRQYYLDLKKTEDYDAIIERYTEKLTGDTLDRYYYEALIQVMECSDVPSYVSGRQIWQHELVWQERNAPRLGYLFFGTPNERSTAIPKRDFYLYFPQPFEQQRYTDNKLPDEVFFRLAEPDEDFQRQLRFYAAARELSGKASGTKRQTYSEKAAKTSESVTRWLRENLLNAFEATYQGRKKKVMQWLEGGKGGDSFRDTVNSVGSGCLSAHFANIAPEYPRFSLLLTSRNIPQAARDAIRGIANPGSRTKQATAVLDALGLLEGDRIEPAASSYAAQIVKLLKDKGANQVLNRQSLIESVDGVEYFLPKQYRLEPEWLAVLLAALVYSGDIVLAIPGHKFDATALPTLATTDIEDIKNFKHIEQPKDWNLPALKALFELMGLVPGLAVDVTQGKSEPVQQLHKSVLEYVDKLVTARQQLLNGIPFWGQNLFTEEESRRMSNDIDQAKEFLEGLQAFNTPGKLKNLKFTREEILGRKDALAKLQEIEELKSFASEINQYTQYLSTASSILPEDHEWVQRSREERDEILKQARDPSKRDDNKFKEDIINRLRNLKKELKDALFPDGNPATPGEFRERFSKFINETLQGRDEDKVRIVLE